MIGHLAAGILTIVSGLCLIGYYIWGTFRLEYEVCGSIGKPRPFRPGPGGPFRQAQYLGGASDPLNVSSIYGRSSRKDRYYPGSPGYYEEAKKLCYEAFHKKFPLPHMLAGGVKSFHFHFLLLSDIHFE